MRTKTLIALAASCLAIFLAAAPATATWPEAVQGDSIGNVTPTAFRQTHSVTVVGDDGSVYLAGTFQDTATFGPFERTSIAGSYDVFVAKYNDLGDVQWVLTGGGPGLERISDLAIDDAGKLYVSGTFTDTAVFGATQLALWGGPEHANPRDIFVAQISDDPTQGGSWTWAEDYGTYGAYGSIGSGDDQAGQLAIDDDATGGKFVYLMGTIAGTRSVSSDTIRCTKIVAPILLRFPIDGGGHARFYPYGAGTWDTGSNDCDDLPATHANGLAVSYRDGSVYVGGNDFSSLTGWVRKVRDDDLNNSVWEHRVANQAPRDLVADGTNHVYVAGFASGSGGFVRKLTDNVATVSSAWFRSFSGLVQVEGIVLSADGSRLFSIGTSDADHARIHAFDALGAASPTVAQIANVSGTGSTTGVSIATDGASKLYVSGKLEGTASFGVEELTSTGPRAAYLASLDTAGNWATFARFDVGEAIVPPLGVVAGAAPTPEIEGVASPGDYVYWDGSEAFPVRETPASLRLIWPASGGGELEQTGLAVWPDDPQLHIAGADVPLDSASHSFRELHYSDGGESSTDDDIFERAVNGFSTLRYEDGGGGTAFEVVLTTDFDGLGAPATPAVDIGTEILLPGHSRTDNAFLASALAPIDAAGPERAFDAPSRTGQILPVNVNGGTAERQLRLVGYAAGSVGVRWPSDPYLYTPAWPSAPFQIVIKDQNGSEGGGQPPLDPTVFVSPRLYVQNDVGQAGFNPNDEHAIMAPSRLGSGFAAAFALRAEATTASEPYTLVKYRDPDDDLRWKLAVYEVVGSGTGAFDFDIVAGGQVPAPYPLVLVGDCPDTFANDLEGTPYYEDVRGGVHARANGEMEVWYFYPLQDNFYYDPNGTGADVGFPGQCVSFVDQAAHYRVDWPSDAPTLVVGETLVEPKNGLPDILRQAAVKVAYQGSDLGTSYQNPSDAEADPTAIVKLFDALSPRWIEVPTDFPIAILERAPFYLRARFEHDVVSVPNRLAFQGYYDPSLLGEPLLLINVMSDDEKMLLLDLSTEPYWQDAIDALHDLSRDPDGLSAVAGDLTIGMPAPGDPPSLLGAQGALSAGAATASGYVTLAFNDDASLDPGALPIDLQVVRVACGPGGSLYQGTVHTLPSDNVFDERLTLRHSGDFGGEPERYSFDWHYQIDEGGAPTTLPPVGSWLDLPPPGPEGVAVTIEGADELTLSDAWLLTTYTDTDPAPVCGQSPYTGDPSSTPTSPSPKLAEGWIKRVIRGLDPFRARTAAFHESPTATYASMIELAGEPYAGPVAFNGDPANVNQLGLIETYESVLRRGIELSIANGVTLEAVNTALLLAAGRIADLTMLLGNEAWVDAQDPTIGFGTQSGVYGSLAPSIFAFQNQLPDLLAEELALLRGRDGSSAAVNLRPVYNRLIWNIETGDVGEAAYSQVYNLVDRNLDGFIDSADARIQYPQGHGDAWGHYTSALKGYYRLLRHPSYSWTPRAEAIEIAGTAVTVDYRDERKLAAAAAARARAGAEIVNLTYRDAYVEDPAGQWQGYEDPDPERAWGLTGWARRAGQGAYLDWVTANALLPAEWQNPGAEDCPIDDDLLPFLGAECLDVPDAASFPEVGKIDRGRVPELSEISQLATELQAALDTADAGLNPLGLARGVVPFDIDPSQIDPGSNPNSGKTHYEQIDERARRALDGAVTVFDHANQLTQTLRRNQDSLVDFSRNVEDRERDIRNRLIEIFGYPYSDDIGPGGTYPAGYDDADLYHYMVVDPLELTGDPQGSAETVIATFGEIDGLGYFPDPDLDLEVPSLAVEFSVDRDGIGIVPPDSWTGSRKAPGDIQRALSEYYQAVNLFDQAISAYDCNLADIDSALEVLEAQYALNAEEIDLLGLGTIQSLNEKMFLARQNQLALRRTGEFLDGMTQAAIDGLPKVVGVSANDVSNTARALIATTALLKGQAFAIGADAEESTELRHEQALAEADAATELGLATARGEFEVVQRVAALEQLIRAEPGLLLEVYNRRERVRQALGGFQQTLARGMRLLDELRVLRQRTAADVQQYRYQDLAFRVTRNDALQKYRAQFDLAARYVYLAASAYDYETNLLGTAGGAGRELLTDIVRHRSLGEVIDGVPQAGSRGLADPLARMGLNFQVLKGQLGFNNPQTETTRFSLRSELLRIDTTADEDPDWRTELEKWRVDNVWDLPEFRRFARPFAPEPAGPCTVDDRSGCEPALVIGFEGNGGRPMGTKVVAGLNWFGHALGAGDSAYDATRFATRIRSAGLWMTGYESAGLSATPTVYVLPVGEDVLRSPTAGDFTTRRWSVVDQVLPVPFPIGASSLDDPLYIPINDSLSGVSGQLGDVRRISSFRAYPDTGQFEPSQTTTDSRLIGRSVANTRWLVIIPGRTLLADPDVGLDQLIEHVSDIKLFFQTYAYSGN